MLVSVEFGYPANNMWRSKTSRAATDIYAFVLALSIVLNLPDGCKATSMPSELQGVYTFSDSEQCGYLTIEAARFRMLEDLSCSPLAVKQQEAIGQMLEFKLDLVCRVDDPKPVRVTGLIDYAQLKNTWILVMRLSVPVLERKRVSIPQLQLFAKCE
jgi:hypothetical protein